MSNTTRAALWMVFFCASIACLSGMIRYMSGVIPALEMVFFRNLFSWFFMMPMVAHAGWKTLKTTRTKAHILRAIFGTLAMSCWFMGLTLIPISEATALNFTVPLFTTLGAALFLGEKVKSHRWIALCIGFAGTLVIVRPGMQEVQLGTILILASSIFMSCTFLTVKRLSSTDHPATIVFYMGLFMTPMSLVGAAPVWVWPEPSHYVWLIGMGFSAAVGHFAMAKAMSCADASVSMPFSFTHMIFASAIAYFFFAESIDLYTWIGAGIIFSSTLYIVRREAALKKKAAT
ncbi:DMT family transporter [Terasakiella sp. A23]|uniref:DMT family transporter n=1 Tax=Terasakiella sp. FCG-A23 TaxID=3080561 RepID=UPI002952F913|nr:DMT family transporter [Terasakiella sp. A23]MDV7340700.1 DMT family transporter [Terasakiella sp. A23]